MNNLERAKSKGPLNSMILPLWLGFSRWPYSFAWNGALPCHLANSSSIRSCFNICPDPQVGIPYNTCLYSPLLWYSLDCNSLSNTYWSYLLDCELPEGRNCVCFFTICMEQRRCPIGICKDATLCKILPFSLILSKHLTCLKKSLAFISM